MRDDDEIITLICDRCGKEKRHRVPAGTDPRCRSRCCRFFMRVLTRTTLGGESPPLHSKTESR